VARRAGFGSAALARSPTECSTVRKSSTTSSAYFKTESKTKLNKLGNAIKTGVSKTLNHNLFIRPLFQKMSSDFSEDVDMDLEEIEEDIVVEDPMDLEEEAGENDSFEITQTGSCPEEDRFDYIVGQI
jgi:hypothetical protein